MQRTIDAGRMPAVFISHGAPTLVLDDGAAHRFLGTYGRCLERPRAILLMSAHFDAPTVTLTAGAAPPTVHDFSGFPPALYELRYPAPGDPTLARRAAGLLAADGIDVELDARRGFDHGAWVPLRLMFPAADIPLVQISIDSTRDAAFHFRLGELLRPLRDEGVLLLGSGGATHNLNEISWHGHDRPPPAWARDFGAWLHDTLVHARVREALAYREYGPFATRNHPTADHFLPVPFVLGASYEDEARRRVHRGWDYGSLSMDIYQFGSVSAAASADLRRAM